MLTVHRVFCSPDCCPHPPLGKRFSEEPPFPDGPEQVGCWNERKARLLVPSSERVIYAQSPALSITGHPPGGKLERGSLLWGLEPRRLARAQRPRLPSGKGEAVSQPDLKAHPHLGPEKSPSLRTSADLCPPPPSETSVSRGPSRTRVGSRAADAVAAASRCGCAGCCGYSCVGCGVCGGCGRMVVVGVRWLQFLRLCLLCLCGDCRYSSSFGTTA